MTRSIQDILAERRALILEAAQATKRKDKMSAAMLRAQVHQLDAELADRDAKCGCRP